VQRRGTRKPTFDDAPIPVSFRGGLAESAMEILDTPDDGRCHFTATRLAPGKDVKRCLCCT